MTNKIVQIISMLKGLKKAPKGHNNVTSLSYPAGRLSRDSQETLKKQLFMRHYDL